MFLDLNNSSLNAYRVEITLFFLCYLPLLSSYSSFFDCKFSLSSFVLSLTHPIPFTPFASLLTPNFPIPLLSFFKSNIFSLLIKKSVFPVSMLLLLFLLLHPFLVIYRSQSLNLPSPLFSVFGLSCLLFFLVFLCFSLRPFLVSIFSSGRRSVGWMSTTLPSGPFRSAM